MENIKLEIDGRTMEAAQGTTLLQAAKSIGIEIPTHCSDDSLRPYGACRMCMVEITQKDRKRLVAACIYEVEEGLVVRTRTGEIDKIRKMIIELTWPNLSRYAGEYGAQEDRFENVNEDCTLCGKCERFCAEEGMEDIVYCNGRGVERTVDVILSGDYDYSVYKKWMSFCSCGKLKNRIMSYWSE